MSVHIYIYTYMLEGLRPMSPTRTLITSRSQLEGMKVLKKTEALTGTPPSKAQCHWVCYW